MFRNYTTKDKEYEQSQGSVSSRIAIDDVSTTTDDKYTQTITNNKDAKETEVTVKYLVERWETKDLFKKEISKRIFKLFKDSVDEDIITLGKGDEKADKLLKYVDSASDEIFKLLEYKD